LLENIPGKTAATEQGQTTGQATWHFTNLVCESQQRNVGSGNDLVDRTTDINFQPTASGTAVCIPKASSYERILARNS